MSSVHYFEAQKAGGIHERVRDKLARAWRRLRPKPQDARRRILPGQSWGTWAAGWDGPAMPGERGHRHG